MKKGFMIFLRVIFILLLMAVAAYFVLRTVYVQQSKTAIEQSLVMTNVPVIGDKNLPFTIVEFFDYRCPHCSTMSHLVDEALQGDSQTKILLRPVAVGGKESLQISAFVLAVGLQKAGATEVLHQAIMNLDSPPDFDIVKSLAKGQGIDVGQAEQDSQTDAIKSVVVMNTQLVSDIGFNRVPALVIGDKGYVPREDMPTINQLKLMILDAKTRLGVIK